MGLFFGILLIIIGRIIEIYDINFSKHEGAINNGRDRME